MTRPKGTRDLQEEIRSAVGGPTPDLPTIGEATGYDIDSPAAWLNFTDALDADDAAVVRRFLADRQLPQALANPLATVRSEAKRLEELVACVASEQDIETAKATLAMLRQAHPASVQDAEKIGKRIAELIREVANMEQRRSEAKCVRSKLAGLRYVFSELFTGGPGGKACAGLPAEVHNALVRAGFDTTELFGKPWIEAYKLRLDRGPARRRRLRTVEHGQ